MKKIIFIILLITVSGCSKNTFEPFFVHDRALPNSIREIKNSSGSSYTEFSIRPECIGDDCRYGSTRSELVEGVWERKIYGLGQPKSAWYGYEIFLPDSFPSAGEQTGKYLLGQWHNGLCPHISVVNRRETDRVGIEFLGVSGGNCRRAGFIPFTELGEMRNQWTKLEFEITWDEKDGKAIVFVNGQKKVEHQGRTLTLDLPQKNRGKNSFRYGIYLCCTYDHKKIIPTYARYRNVSRATRREDLLVNVAQSR
jgi:hypothetical protein